MHFTPILRARASRLGAWHVAEGIALEYLATTEVPVLLFLSTTDNLPGSADKGAKASSFMPNVQIEVVDSSHLANVEAFEAGNTGIREFLGTE